MYFGVLCNQVVDLNVENFAEIARKIVLPHENNYYISAEFCIYKYAQR